MSKEMSAGFIDPGIMGVDCNNNAFVYFYTGLGITKQICPVNTVSVYGMCWEKCQSVTKACVCEVPITVSAKGEIEVIGGCVMSANGKKLFDNKDCMILTPLITEELSFLERPGTEVPVTKIFVLRRYNIG